MDDHVRTPLKIKWKRELSCKKFWRILKNCICITFPSKLLENLKWQWGPYDQTRTSVDENQTLIDPAQVSMRSNESESLTEQYHG